MPVAIKETVLRDATVVLRATSSEDDCYRDQQPDAFSFAMEMVLAWLLAPRGETLLCETKEPALMLNLLYSSGLSNPLCTSD